MKTLTGHEKRSQIAVGYIRVSTQEQACEGVSLDAQRDKLTMYCQLQGITLLDIKADEGVTGSTLNRRGLQAALKMLSRGQADTLVVVKVDRLSRSLGDLCALVDEYFRHDRYHLLSLCGMANTHTAAGRMLLMNLGNYAQFEREMISERTREAMQYLKQKGIVLGSPIYGYRVSRQLDDKGRRVVEEDPTEQATLRRMIALREAGMGCSAIARTLNSDGVPARGGGAWGCRFVSVLLQRAGKHTPRPYKRSIPRVMICDKDEAAERARDLHARGLSLRKIGAVLHRDGYATERGGDWHAASVRALLTHGMEETRVRVLRRAQALRTAGHSFRQIAACLTREGLLPPSGGRWHPGSVSDLLARG